MLLAPLVKYYQKACGKQEAQLIVTILKSGPEFMNLNPKRPGKKNHFPVSHTIVRIERTSGVDVYL